MLALAALSAAALAIALSTAPGALAAKKTVLASGVVPNETGGFPWELRVERRRMAGMPGLCLETDHSWDADGTAFGNISSRCVAGRVGGRFSLHAGSCDGVFSLASAANRGEQRIRQVALALDPRARVVKVVFSDGTRVRLRTHKPPRSLRLPVRFAWHVDAGEAIFPSRIAAYGPKSHGKRRIVGRLRRNC